MFYTIVLATEVIVIISAISVDAFSTAFTYGIDKIGIPLKSSMIIHTVSSLSTLLSYFMGMYLSIYIVPALTNTIAFIVLMFIGIAKLFESIIKSSLTKCNAHKKDIAFSLMDLKFILSVYADPNTADADCSKSLSVKEAAVLAITLSLDNLPVGVGLGISKAPIICIIISAIIAEEIALRTGYLLGKKISGKFNHDISWIGGVLLIILAITKLI